VGAGVAGFAGAGAALAAVSAQNDGLQQQISSGQLKMNPDSANKAAAVYEEKAAVVDDLVFQVDELQLVGGLGEYPSSQQLAQKFGQKARNGSTGAADLLGLLADELRRKADLFREAAKDYAATDEQNAQDMQRGSKL
jgi:hypothetical protein